MNIDHELPSQPEPSEDPKVPRFLGRQELLDQLAEWLKPESGSAAVPAVQFLHFQGDGGSGKAHLAAEAVVRLRTAVDRAHRPGDPPATVVLWERGTRVQSSEAGAHALEGLCERSWRDPSHKVVIVRDRDDRSVLPAALRTFPVVLATKQAVSQPDGEPAWTFKIGAGALPKEKGPEGAAAQTAARERATRFNFLVKTLSRDVAEAARRTRAGDDVDATEQAGH